jgi:thiol reductant ABC exporter CydC subunit
MKGTAAAPAHRPLVEVALIARGSWPRLALAALAGAGALGAAIGLTATSAWLLSRAAQHPPVLTLMVAIVAVRAFGLARGVLRYAERLLAHDAAFRILASTRVTVFSALERLAPAGLGDYRSGELLGRLVDDVDGLQDLYLRIAVPVAAGAGVGLLTATGIGLASPAAGGALAVGLVLAGLAVPWWSARAGAHAEIEASAVRSELTVTVLDAVEGAPDLLAWGADLAHVAHIEDLDRRLARAGRAGARVAAIGAALTSLTSGGTTLVCLMLGIAAVRSGHLPGVLLATVVLTPLAAFEAVASFPAAAQHLGRLRAGAARVIEVLDRRPPVNEPAVPAAAPRTPLTVRLDSVTASWPGSAHPALRDITLDLPPGCRVAIVGPSGAGKSTLGALLLDFLRPDAGRVLFGGRDLRDLADDDVRRLVGRCGQDAHIFDASIADNVRIGRVDATDAELRHSLDAAGLLDWVDTLPQDLATPVGEHGRQLSGGQRQRLALARELVADHPVVILDEPTEHLEGSLADTLTAELMRAVEGRTTILITHRLSILDRVDEILVLDHGRVLQRGGHAELVEQPGWYRSSWLAQREDAVLVAAGSTGSAG